MLNLAEYRKSRQGLADFLPWAGLMADGAILNKDGSLQHTARFRGPDLDSATPAELVGTTARLNNALRRLGSGWAMLLNQARNLTSLPVSSLQAIEQSISRTQQLLNQAQRLSYDINQIDQAFGRSYPQTYAGSTSSHQLVGHAQTPGQDSLAAYPAADR